MVETASIIAATALVLAIIATALIIIMMVIYFTSTPATVITRPGTFFEFIQSTTAETTIFISSFSEPINYYIDNSFDNSTITLEISPSMVTGNTFNLINTGDRNIGVVKTTPSATITGLPVQLLPQQIIQIVMSGPATGKVIFFIQ
jgi:hypothetical protein